MRLPYSAARLGPSLYESMSGGRIIMRIGQDAQRMVVFFAVTGEKGLEYGGTGFLVRDEEQGIPVDFLVTCRHVAEPLSRFEEFFIRINLTGAGAEEIPIQSIKWAYHPDKTVDLAAVPLNIWGSKYDARYYSLKDSGVCLLADKKLNNIVCGDVVAVVGLFRLHAGKKRNVPMVHTGHLAAIADAHEPIPLRDRLTNQIVQSEVHLIEVQTLDGISGSPVFIHQVTSLTDLKMPDGGSPKAFGNAKLFGLYAGSWDGEPGAILAADRNLLGGRRVPVGMGAVVPADKIIELLREHPDAKKFRTAVVQKALAETAAEQG